MFFGEITKWVDEGSPVDVIYLNFQKAFDKVPHQTLILKLKSHGMGDSIINWIEQWLKYRRQRVVVDVPKNARAILPDASNVPLHLSCVTIARRDFMIGLSSCYSFNNSHLILLNLKSKRLGIQPFANFT